MTYELDKYGPIGDALEERRRLVAAFRREDDLQRRIDDLHRLLVDLEPFIGYSASVPDLKRRVAAALAETRGDQA